MNEEEFQLAQRFEWWWQLFEIYPEFETKIEFRLYQDRWKRSAYIYELGKRVTGSYEFGDPWHKLPLKTRQQLAARWPMDNTFLTTTGGGLGRKQKDRLADFDGVYFNLDASDEALVRMFKTEIAHQRRLLGIPSPKPNAGKVNRGVSFRPVELMDLGANKVRPLSASERSQVSKARRFFKASI